MKPTPQWQFENPTPDDLDYIHPFLLNRNRPHRLSRRTALAGLVSFGAWGLLSACSQGGFSDQITGTTGGAASDVAGGSCAVIPTETKGPYPLDGSNGTNALSGIYRSNVIGSDISSTSGVPLRIVLNLQNTNDGCVPIANAAVYIWHCDQYGQYSGYSSSQNGAHAGKTFCRGIQVSDANGQVEFTTLYPGWYNGRITHVHLGVYPGNDLGTAPKISQFGFPQEITKNVYSTTPYSTHGQNTSVTGFASDNVFSDGAAYQIASMSGSVNAGLIATLNVGMPLS